MAEKVVTMGEIMMRLSPPNNLRFVQTDSFDVVYGGGKQMLLFHWQIMVWIHILSQNCLSIT